LPLDLPGLEFEASGNRIALQKQKEGRANGLAISFTARVKVPAHVLVQEIAGESVLLNLENERYFGLDETGTRMWAALVTEGSIQSAYERLLGEYDVDADKLRSDIQDLVEKLVENGLVEAAGE
jgi:Coenzyme PQQ synthesis protein D (PqqD)